MCLFMRLSAQNCIIHDSFCLSKESPQTSILYLHEEEETHTHNNLITNIQTKCCCCEHVKSKGMYVLPVCEFQIGDSSKSQT